MRKVLVMGCPGSGKTTLSVALSKKTGLPIVHLDRLFWRDNWTHATREEFDALLECELLKDSWIIDGEFGRTAEKRLRFADTVVYLDFPAVTCVLGVLKRVIKNYGKTRHDMGDGNCPERFDFKFVKYVLNYRKTQRKKTLSLINESGIKTVIFKNRKEMRNFLKSL